MKIGRGLSTLLLLGVASLNAWAGLIDFEGLPDSTSVTNQYSGLIFTNATVFTAGVSLNEFEFPPHSGSNVVFDDGGPISIFFSTPILSFSGFFTYSEPLLLAAFDTSLNSVGSTNSTFSNNLALSGDPGTSPNDFLQLAFAGGISKIMITGDELGSSFVMDDVSYALPSAGVPEPSTLSVVLLAAVGLIGYRGFRTRIIR